MGLEGVKIVSGGQTGADGAALDFAIASLALPLRPPTRASLPNGTCPRRAVALGGQLGEAYE